MLMQERDRRRSTINAGSQESGPPQSHGMTRRLPRIYTYQEIPPLRNRGRGPSLPWTSTSSHPSKLWHGDAQRNMLLPALRKTLRNIFLQRMKIVDHAISPDS